MRRSLTSSDSCDAVRSRRVARVEAFRCERYCAGDVAGERGGRAVGVLSHFDGINGAAVDWSSEAIREALGRAYSPDVELRTLAIGSRARHRRELPGPARLGRVFAGVVGAFQRVSRREPRLRRGWRLRPRSESAMGCRGRGVAPRSRLSSPPCSSCGTARSRGFASSTPWMKPSKPPGGRSRRRRRASSAASPC